MKIAIDIRAAGPQKTGKGWYTYNIVEQILKLDKKNEYILYASSPENPFKKTKNSQLKVIEAKPHQWHFEVLKDLRANPVDLFFAPTSYIIPAFAPKSLKTIITVHDMVAFLFPSTHNTKAMLIERLTLKRALKKAKKVLTVSENTKKDLLKKFDYPAENIHIASCAPADFYRAPIDPQEMAQFKEKMNLPNNFLLAVGTIEPRKNLSTLIKSLVMIKKWHPDYKLVIVGKKGWKFQNIEKIIKQYKLENDVIFSGYLDGEDIHKLYALAKVFVFPSLYEGFGIPPLEAMASGCAVVTSNVASLPEVVGEAAILIDPKNAYKIADNISSLLQNESVRATMIERGFNQAQKFTWEDSARAALETFNSLAP